MSRPITLNKIKKEIHDLKKKQKTLLVSSSLEVEALNEYIDKYGPIVEGFRDGVKFRDFLYEKMAKIIREDKNGLD